ncbi:MAG: Cys-tRNA(Pro) deacylase [Erysipelotrichaceae bacterium]|nr:Cys-tRNA(Pro) deacylase [Erysipelotrichaceae bacterium]
MKQERTNVMRLLDSLQVQFSEHTYESDGSLSGIEVAQLIGQDPQQVFKTLVTVGNSGEHFVFVIPVNKELNLKKAAKATGQKSIEMIKSRELLPLTGYIHGGCSPIGMKKFFRTTIDETAILFDTIIFSAGKIGFQVEISLDELKKAIDFSLADLV